ncbi:MAG: hypothetical protein ACU0C9_06700 [Paracoccaceae bacterium]
MQIHSIRSVLSAAETILNIVPLNSDFVFAANIAVTDVDQVHVGQAAILRFPAFDARTTPELQGIVSKLSADSYQDTATGGNFYKIELTLAPDETASLAGKPLVPGMPVQAFVRTGEHSPLAYLIKPFSDYFHTAFREQ